LLNQHITESLAGRAAILTLLPLSNREIEGVPDSPLPWENDAVSQRPFRGQKELWESFLRGGYPELAAKPDLDADMWFASYINTYLERDVRSLRQIGDLNQFQVFLRTLAAQSGSLLNLNSLSRDLGMSMNTLKKWLSLLEATYLVFILRPYHANISKRLVKTPKVYFSDVGLLCRLVGLNQAEHAMNSVMSGAIMETAVINEVIRTIRHRGVEPKVYFWRTSTGVEVDLLVEIGGRVIPVEIKQTATPTPSMAAGIASFRADFGPGAGTGYVVHSGDSRRPLGNGVVAWPFSEF
jgi:predicted AAA+ superfamily ATPase